MSFTETLPDTLRDLIGRIQPCADEALAARIQDRLDHLTKPRGSLGRMEEIAMRYGLARVTAEIVPPRKALFVFCADHGVTDEGVSPYPREVTHQMVRNFLAGGAAVNVLCRQYEIDPLIVDMGVAADFASGLALVSRKIAYGTRNFRREPAMTREQALQSIEAGARLAKAAAELCYGLLAVGEMGIGNTTSASAISAALAGCEAEAVVGPGAGLTAEGVGQKIAVVADALALHHLDSQDPLGVLAAVGGFEIGGICGFVLGAAAHRIPVVVDGFIASAGAALALKLQPAAGDYLFWGHRSTESGHSVLLEMFGARPLLDLDMRLGEGSGAAVAVSVIDGALRLYREMATFRSAGVSEKTGPG